VKFLSCSFRLVILAAIFLVNVHVAQAEQPPFLSLGHAVSPAGSFVTTNSKFSGGVSVANGELKTVASASISNEMVVKFTIQVDSNDIGKQADLLVVVGKEPNAPFDGGVDTVYNTIDEFGNLSTVDLYNQPSVWMNQLTTHPFKSNVTLQAEMPISVSIGKAFKRSMLYTFAGYRLRDEGTLSYSLSPAISEVKQQFIMTKVSDPNTDIGFIFTNNTGDEVVIARGEKDTQGNLKSVSSLEQITKNSNPKKSVETVHTVFGDGTTPSYLKRYSTDGKSLELKNYNPATKTGDFILTKSDGEQIVAENQPVGTPSSTGELPDSASNIPKDISGKDCISSQQDIGDWVAVCVLGWATTLGNKIFGTFCEQASGGLIQQIVIALTDYAAELQGSKNRMCAPMLVPEGYTSPEMSSPKCYSNPMNNLQTGAGATDIILHCRNPLDFKCLEGLLSVGSFLFDKLVKGEESCNSEPFPDTTAWIHLDVASSPTKVGEPLMLKIQFKAPERIHTGIGIKDDNKVLPSTINIYSFNQYDGYSQTGGTIMYEYSSVLWKSECGKDVHIKAFLNPENAFLPHKGSLAESNEVTAIWACDK